MPQAGPGSDRAVFKVTINGTIDAVWREITRTDKPQGAFFNMRLHTPGLAPGAPMQMRTKNGRHTGAVGEVLEFDPPHRYSHTLKFTNLNDPPCVVTYDLKETPAGVEFMMTVSRIPVGTKSAKQLTSGGTMIVNTLKAIVETGRPSLGTRALYAMFGLLGFTTPAACKAEHWPVDKVHAPLSDAPPERGGSEALPQNTPAAHGA